jgi:hypothetical protein
MQTFTWILVIISAIFMSVAAFVVFRGPREFTAALADFIATLIQDLIVTAGSILNLVPIAGAIIYLVGNFTAYLVVVLGGYHVGYEFLSLWNVSELNTLGMSQLAKELFTAHSVQIAIGFVMAGTVAIAHLKKYSLDRKQYWEKLNKEALEAAKQKQDEDKARFAEKRLSQKSLVHMTSRSNNHPFQD